MLISNEGNIAETPLKLDFHPDNTIIKSGVMQATINPYVCAVPLKISPVKGETEGDTWTNFFGGTAVNKNTNKKSNDLRTALQGVAAATNSFGAYLSSLIFSKKTNLEKNVINTPSLNELNSLIDYINVNDENNNIKLFDVLVNITMSLDVFQQL